MRLLLYTAGWLYAVTLIAPAFAQSGSAPAVQGSVQVDSVSAADSTLADTFRTASGLDLVVPSDSVRRSLDSAAVAALVDTSQVLPPLLREGMPVLFFGRTLFRIYGPLGEVSAVRRAELLAARLEQLAGNPNATMDSLRVIDGIDLTTIQLDDLIVMTVTESEAQALGLPRRRVALNYADAIQEAFAQHREQSTVKGLLKSAAWSVVLFIVLLLLLRGLGWVYRQLDARTVALRRLVIRPIRLGGNEIVAVDHINRVGQVFVRLSRLALSLILVYLFLTTVFSFFPWTQAWSERLLSYALAPVQGFANMIVEGAPNLLAIAVIIVLVRALIRGSDYIFRQVEAGTFNLGGFHPELADPTRKIARFLLVILGIMLVYPYTPIAESRVFQGLTVFLGILFSLGSSSAISNIVAGVVLTYTRAFRLGDRVKVGDTLGDVVEKTFLVTRIRTPKNEDVAVPNSMVLSNHIVNYSLMCREGNGVILHTTVTIGYDVPWPRVRELLLEAAVATDGVEPEPPPFVLQTALGDFSVSYQLNVFTKQAQRMAGLYSDLHAHIQDAFNRAEIEILSPVFEAQRDGNPLTIPQRPDLGTAGQEVTASGDGAETSPEAVA